MARVRAGIVAAVLQFVAGAGGDPARVRAAAGLREGDLLDPERMLELDLVAAILVSAAEELEDPAFGLHLGATFDLGALGLVTYAVLNASTVEIGLNNLVRYIGTLVEGAQAELETARGVSVLRARLEGAEPEAFRHVYDGALLLMLRMLRHLVGEDEWRPQAVAMGHDAPADTSQHVRHFGVEPSFAQPSNEIRFDASILPIKVSGADRLLLPAVEQRLQEVLAADPADEPWLAALRVQIASRLCDGHPSLPSVAPGSGASARTLQRKLAERGLVYRELVQQARHRLALQYLERTDTDLTEIAFLLGYSELSAFAHAFGRWTGGSPGAHRRARRARGRGPTGRRGG
jgi:AraC-like DNA-binding protein